MGWIDGLVRRCTPTCHIIGVGCAQCFEQCVASYHDHARVNTWDSKKNACNSWEVTKTSYLKYWFTCSSCDRSFNISQPTQGMESERVLSTSRRTN